jgi:predicted acyl esterase
MSPITVPRDRQCRSGDWLERPSNRFPVGVVERANDHWTTASRWPKPAKNSKKIQETPRTADRQSIRASQIGWHAMISAG